MAELHDNIEKIEPTELIPYSNNPKSHPEEQVDKIASSIKNYGFVQPIVTDQDNEVIIGHGRLQAAKKLGLEKVPVIKHDNLAESEIKALRLADNRIADTPWEVEKLGVELEQLIEENNFEDLMHGFDEKEFDSLIDSMEENTNDAMKEWEKSGMPETETKDSSPDFELKIFFENPKDFEEFAEKIDREEVFEKKLEKIWYPKQEDFDAKNHSWEGEIE